MGKAPARRAEAPGRQGPRHRRRRRLGGRPGGDHPGALPLAAAGLGAAAPAARGDLGGPPRPARCPAPDALALAARAEGADPARLLNGYAWEAMLPELLSRAGRPDLLRGLSTDPEAGALALSYWGRGAPSRAAELASLLNALVASGEEVLALVRSGKVDWDG